MAGDLERLQGAWSVSSLEMDGVEAPEAMLAGAGVVVTGDRFISTGMGADYAGTLKVNGKSKPAQVDMLFDEGPEKGNTNLGIYELKGDSWRLCLATRGSVRPASFASIPGSGFAVETLVRGKAVGKKKVSKAAQVETPAASGPVTEFEGEWQMVSATMSGKPMNESDMQWVRRVTVGNQTTVMAGPQVMLKVEFTHDTKAGTIDYVGLAGAVKGKSQMGIYKFEGDVVTFCVAPPGKARPAEFTSSASDGRTLTAWRKG